MLQSLFYKSVSSIMVLLDEYESAAMRGSGLALFLIDNLGVATSSLNASAFTLTVIERLVELPGNRSLAVIASA